MTLVLGVRTASGCILAADSLASNSETGSAYLHRTPKCFNISAQVAVATTGSFRFAQIIRAHYSLSRTDAEQSDFQKDAWLWAVRWYVPKLRKLAKEHMPETEEDEKDTAQHHLLAVRDRIFYVDGDWHVGDHDRCYASAGMGEDFSLGALSIAFGEKEPTSKAEVVLRLAEIGAAVEHHCVYVRRPFQMVETVTTTGKKAAGPKVILA